MEAGTETAEEQMSETDTGSVEERVDRLEAGQQTLSDKLDQLIGLVSKRPAAKDDDGAERPDTATMVQMELERRDKEKAEAAEKEAEKSERQQMRELAAQLREAPPAQPQRRSTRVMWGPR